MKENHRGCSGRLVALALLVLGSACNLQPLRSEQLYGAAEADAAVTDAAAEDAAREAMTASLDARPADVTADDGPPPDAAAPDLAPDAAAPDLAPDRTPEAAPEPACDLGNVNGSVSGTVIDACNQHPLYQAQVGIAGKHTCAWVLKGSFFIPGLPVGCDLTLTSGLAGYADYVMVVHTKPNGNPNVTIALQRQGGCATEALPAPMCSCTDNSCAHP